MQMTRSGAVWLWLLLRVKGFIQVASTVISNGGAEFGLKLGTPMRLRLWGCGGDADLVRRTDGHRHSCWGQPGARTQAGPGRGARGRMAVQFLERSLEVAVKGLGVGLDVDNAR
ncbi:hypothetical protein ACIHQR_01235 [Corallococcus coralloides]|uniref:hypothetical protein n=1 Tax=Corallococcus coralloides TaxID=184914 RepID=UPI00384CCDCF